MKLKRHIRKLIRFIFFSLVALVVLFIVFYYFPVSGNYLDDWLTRRFNNELGLRGEVKGACVYLSRGVITIREIILPPQNASGQPLYLQNISILFSPLDVFLSKSDSLQEIYLSCPNDLSVVVKDDRLALSKDYEYINPLIKKILASKSKKGKIRLSRIHLDIDRIKLGYVPQNLENETPVPLATMKKLSLVFSLHKGLLGVVTSQGTLQSEVEADFRGYITFDPFGFPDHAMLFFSHLLFTEKTLPGSSFSVEISGLKINEKISRTISGIYLDHDIIADYISIKPGNKDLILSENNISLTGKTEFNLPYKTVLFRDSHLVFEDSSLRLDGSLEYIQPYPFSFAIFQNPVSSKTVTVFKQLILPEGWDLALQENSLDLFVRASGSLDRIRKTRVIGKLGFSGVALRHQNFPLPITGLKGSLALDNSQLKLNQVSGKLGDGTFRLNSQLRGFLDPSQPIEIFALWNADLSLHDIRMMLENPFQLSEYEIAGRMHTKGSLVYLVSPTDKITSGCFQHFHSSLDITQGSLSHPRIPDKIEKINARLIVNPETIQFEKFEAAFPNAQFQVHGTLSGENRFWSDTRINGQTSYKGEITPLVRLTPAPLRKELQDMNLTGQVMLKAKGSGFLRTLDRGRYSGEVSWNNVGFTPLSPLLNGEFSTLSGRLDFNGKNVHIKDVNGNFAGLDFDLEADLENNNLACRLQSRVDLKKLEIAVPPLAQDFRGTGTVSLNTSVSLDFSDLTAVLNHEMLPKDMPLDISGTILSQDASFAYSDMPVDLNRIKGEIRFSRDSFSFNDVSFYGGKSPDCRVTGEILLTSNPSVVRFVVNTPEFYFREWCGSWERSKPGFSPFVSMEDLTSTSPTIELDGTVLADTIYFNRMKGENFHGHFIYNYFPSGPNKFSFDDIRVNAYGGSMEASGNLLFPTGSFFYGVEGETENVALNPLLSALRGKEDRFTGLLSSSFTLAGRADNPNSISSRIVFDVQQSRFIGNLILVGLGKSLHSTIFDDITFSRVRGEVQITDGAAWFKDVRFTSPLVNLNTSGTVDFHENMNVVCYLFFQKRHIFSLPVIKQLTEILEFMGKAMLKFQVSGTLENPQIKTIPLSTDELGKIIPGL